MESILRDKNHGRRKGKFTVEFTALLGLFKCHVSYISLGLLKSVEIKLVKVN